MKERPILFNAEMVRAILEGRKTQTRRPIKPQPPKNEDFPGSDFDLVRSIAEEIKFYSLNWYDELPKHPTGWELEGSVGVARNAGLPMQYHCPYGKPGDRLWVREAWCQVYAKVDPERPIIYRADGDAPSLKSIWKPSIHMPRWASRITLEITDIRVERVQDMSEEDAIAEGVCKVPGDPGYFDYLKPRQTKTHRLSAQDSFRTLWDSIYSSKNLGWDANPWVWVVEFKRVEGLAS